jgi:NAD(P)-dependent dehydrogenase (short-subunit alcohol dehydrogenase family)
VHLLDVNPIAEGDLDDTPNESTVANLHYTQCNVCDWPRLRKIFDSVGHVDIAVANAGISQECDYFADTFGEDGELEEPGYKVLDVNFRAVLNFTKLSLRTFKKQGPGGSLVITTSATAYSPEQTLPVYSASKLAVSRRGLNSPSFLVAG